MVTESVGPTVLIIDDDHFVRRSIRAWIEALDYRVFEAGDGLEGLHICQCQQVDAVLLDVRMSGMGGLEILQELRSRYPNLPVIMVSAVENVDDVVAALRLGARDYLFKPIIDVDILRHALEKSLEYAKLTNENRKYQEELELRVEEKTEELETLNKRLCKVVESASKFFGCGTIEDSGLMILEEFATHMKASGGSLYTVSADFLELVAWLDKIPPPRRLPIPLKKESVFRYVLDTLKPMVIEDIQLEEFFESCGGVNYQSNSCIVFPVLDHQKKILALLALHNKQTRFTQQDKEIGSVLASCASEALQAAIAMKALKHSEELMLQSQKREAIATLAGGITHDFNNILSAIVGYADLGLYRKHNSDEVHANFEQIKKAGHRARELVSQILSISKAEQGSVLSVDLAPTILEALEFVRATFPSSISIEHDVEMGVGNVETDPGRIHQVVMNLCTNAAHAMADKGGVLKVSLARVDVESEPFRLDEIKDKSCLKLSVCDTGTGMDQELLGRIFDPYFTTREKGEGSGLGLAVVQGIVSNLGGAVRVSSSLGAGSCFYIYFPMVAGAGNEKDGVFETTLLPGDERILFVDDEETIAEMARQMLSYLGYRVTIFSCSMEALIHFRQNASQYELVITDLTMPQMSGVEFARKITEIRGDIPVILHTGYSSVVNAAEARAAGVRSFMIKPLSMAKLARQIREVLDTQVR